MKMRSFTRVPFRWLLLAATVFTIVLIIASLTRSRQNPVEEPGFARKSWGQADKVKVYIEDDTAKKLEEKIRVMCLVLTLKQDQETKALAVNQTWGKRCTKLLFVSDQSLGDLPHLEAVSTGRDHLSAKTMAMFKYAYQHHSGEFDWFLKADDDTYMVMENLRHLLSFHDPDESVYLGHHFKRHVDQGYMSGGAGYLLSRQALRIFGEKTQQCAQDGWQEDVDFGKCMSDIGVPPFESKDILGRNSFHSAHFSDDLYWMGYIKEHAPQVKGPINIGPSCCSQLSISFHKVSPSLMYFLEFLLYRMAVFGRHSPDQLFSDFFKVKQIPQQIYKEDPNPHFV